MGGVVARWSDWIAPRCLSLIHQAREGLSTPQTETPLFVGTDDHPDEAAVNSSGQPRSQLVQSERHKLGRRVRGFCLSNEGSAANDNSLDSSAGYLAEPVKAHSELNGVRLLETMRNRPRSPLIMAQPGRMAARSTRAPAQHVAVVSPVGKEALPGLKLIKHVGGTAPIVRLESASLSVTGTRLARNPEPGLAWRMTHTDVAAVLMNPDGRGFNHLQVSVIDLRHRFRTRRHTQILTQHRKQLAQVVGGP